MDQDIPQICLCIELRSAAQKLTKIYDKALKPVGITVTQFSLLHKVQHLDHPTLNDLAKATDLDRSTLGRNLRLLQNIGLIKMQSGTDARTKIIHLTKSGHRLFDQAAPLWQKVQSTLKNRLGEDKRSVLTELLTDLSSDPALS
ncbi:MarR family winged helix-turn-helix transcriptional regulator [Sneathiella marina]|uniref:MarR family winged helix-turn-helix transcriptional regulator n=1 Tax=Sneathiella marina TaxID=2950108 RepID=A0ABY4W5N7_9PROT|nr:MarR family winged helix-turn-helix transcriptional regulator [Sneathiella marina]USG62502.1 MarR family winged helix-turn-helix transcriptional regulator [Sneathiella marina]